MGLRHAIRSLRQTPGSRWRRSLPWLSASAWTPRSSASPMA